MKRKASDGKGGAAPADRSYTDMRPRERIIGLLAGACVLALLGWMFYRSFAAMLFMQIFLPLTMAAARDYFVRRRKWQLTLAFKDAAESLGAALSAGYSVENAFRAAQKDLRNLYPEDADIVKEFAAITAEMPHRSAESGLADFAGRTGIEEADHLAQVMITGRKTGGNLPAMMGATVRDIEEKIEMKRELSVMIAAKQLESRIMCLLPCFMILYLQICSPGYLDPMYTGVFGRAWMTVLLIVYAAAVWMAEKIAAVSSDEAVG